MTPVRVRRLLDDTMRIVRERARGRELELVTDLPDDDFC